MSRPLATSALALILGAGPLLADVTPNEVWQNLRDGYEQMGYQVQVGSEEGSGDQLSLSDVVLTAEDETASDMTLTIPRIDLAATGDGAVRSVVEGRMVLQMRDTLPEGEEVGITLTLDAPGNQTLSSGSADEMQHSFVMPTLVLEGRTLDDSDEVPVTATLTNVEGTQTNATAADGSAAQTYLGSADMLEMQISATGPAAGTDPDMPSEDMPSDDAAPEAEGEATAPTDTAATDSFDATFRISDLTLEGEGTSPAGDLNFGNQPAAALEAGFSGAGRFAMGAIAGSFTSATTGGEGEDATASGEFAAASGALAVSMSAEGLTYEGSSTDMTTQLTSSGMPFPISYAAALNSFRLAMPVVASEEEQSFSLLYALEGLTLDDAIWQALDPEAALPRDPASLTIDLEGQTILSQNFMDPEFADGSQTGPDGEPVMPYQPRSLSINDLSLDAIGASVQMSGDLTFGDDPSQPVGTVTGLFSGIDTLLDSLATMGVVPQDQLMAPRMMMAMFARPVEGNPDQLQTEIEFREGGSIFANGQQIQ
ncbi:DUF2125 domain-containing protein [Paracoccus gahaiensis]|uniref:DUF2125 domain-containing protein n=1 Tax=Paracoccus gahaiensis TaxID=1706839 RepID=A0A4U0RB96_9RHOB|nr:DUF2125 domain-containing protein [Paracoccus gahaiensis]TJZ92176.1 DUF2125 domain-containing protein [Paracoccus gahaiensis]